MRAPSEKSELLIRVEAPHFTAGFIVDNMIVTKAAPIINYLIGKTEANARRYVQQKGWITSLIVSHST